MGMNSLFDDPLSRRQHGTRPTRTSELVDAIRKQIIEGLLRPNERLRFDELRSRFGVGISPLREALTHLAAEGLVVLESRKGFHVAPVSESELLELAMLRAEFDIIGIRESIKNGDAAWEGQIISALHELASQKKIDKSGNLSSEWDDIHARFHDSLVARCESPRLIIFRQTLNDLAVRYRRMSVHYLTSPRDDLAEHREIADAVLKHNFEEASYLIKRHYKRTVDIIIESNR